MTYETHEPSLKPVFLPFLSQTGTALRVTFERCTAQMAVTVVNV